MIKTLSNPTQIANSIYQTTIKEPVLWSELRILQLKKELLPMIPKTHGNIHISRRRKRKVMPKKRKKKRRKKRKNEKS